MSISQYGSIKFTGSHPNKIPDGDGDLLYEQDRSRDFAWLWDRVGALAMDVAPSSAGFYVSGGVVTAHAGNTTFDIGAGVGYAPWNVDLGNTSMVPPGTASETVAAVRVEWTAQSGVGSVSGTTIYYVKIAYGEADGLLRARAKAAGTWYFTKAPSFQVVIDTSPPGTLEILLATATVVSGSIAAITPAQPAAASGTERYAPISGYTPAAGDVVELTASGYLRKMKRIGSTSQIAAAQPAAIMLCKVGTYSFCALYYKTGIGWYARVGVVDPNDLSITYGTEQQVWATATMYRASICAMTSTLALVAQCTDGGQLYVRTLSISGNAITVNGTVSGAATAYLNGVCSRDATTAGLCWSTDAPPGQNLTVALVTVSGTTPSIGSSASSTVGANSIFWNTGHGGANLAISADGKTFTVFYSASASPYQACWQAHYYSAGAWTYSNRGPFSWGTEALPGSCIDFNGTDLLYDASYSMDAAVTYYSKSALYSLRYSGTDGLEIMNVMRIGNNQQGLRQLALMDSAEHVAAMIGAGYVTDTSSLNRIYRLNFVRKAKGASPSVVVGDEIVIDKSATGVQHAGLCCLSGEIAVMAGSQASLDCWCVAFKRQNRIIGVAIDACGTVQRSGTVTLSGLTPNAVYGVDDAGALAASPGTARIGIALSATKLLLQVQPGV